jgi:hypothetical protein
MHQGRWQCRSPRRFTHPSGRCGSDGFHIHSSGAAVHRAETLGTGCPEARIETLPAKPIRNHVLQQDYRWHHAGEFAGAQLRVTKPWLRWVSIRLVADIAVPIQVLVTADRNLPLPTHNSMSTTWPAPKTVCGGWLRSLWQKTTQAQQNLLTHS